MRCRICIIVDHPLRDLDGLVLLACELVRQGVEVFLVPMYDKHEVFLLRPDLVLVNYIRFANIEFIRACRRLGIRVAVLDTEGGVRRDFNAFAAEVSGYLREVDLYCVWGRTQYEALLSHSPTALSVLRVTGCPRYDYTVVPWVDTLRDVEVRPGQAVLINMNFPLVNPRFQTAAREIYELICGMGHDESYVRERIAQTLKAMASTEETTSRLASRFPNAVFIVRPHPFESKEHYQRRLAGHDNVQVVQSGSVLEWIRSCSVVVHYNCSTAVEAFLMRKEPILLAFIDAPLLEQPISVAVSQRAISFEELEGMIERVLAGEEFSVSPELETNRRRIVEEFFYANDGLSHRRVADALLSMIGYAPRNERIGNRVPNVVDVLRAQRRWQATAQLLLTLICGSESLDYMRSLLRRVKVPAAKRFEIGEVRDLVERLAKHWPAFRAIETCPVRQRDEFVPGPGRCRSVLIRPSEDED